MSRPEVWADQQPPVWRPCGRFVTFAVARLTYDLEMGVRIDIKPRLGAYVGVAVREGESLRWHWLAAR